MPQTGSRLLGHVIFAALEQKTARIMSSVLLVGEATVGVSGVVGPLVISAASVVISAAGSVVLA